MCAAASALDSPQRKGLEGSDRSSDALLRTTLGGGAVHLSAWRQVTTEGSWANLRLAATSSGRAGLSSSEPRPLRSRSIGTESCGQGPESGDSSACGVTDTHTCDGAGESAPASAADLSNVGVARPARTRLP
jgi:hypothetical protein